MPCASFAEERELAKQASTPSRHALAPDHRGRGLVPRDGVRYGEYSKAYGCDAILQLIDRMDLDEEERMMREMIDARTAQAALAQRHAKFLKRLASCNPSTRDAHGHRLNDPRAMILEAVPSSPRTFVRCPARRGRFATSDLNDLYDA